MQPGLAACAAVAGLLAVAILSRTASGGRPRYRNGKTCLASLVKESARYVAQSDQDSNVMLAVLHATYAKAFLEAARQVADDAVIAAETRVIPAELAQAAEERQQAALAHVQALHPDLGVAQGVAKATGWVL